MPTARPLAAAAAAFILSSATIAPAQDQPGQAPTPPTAVATLGADLPAPPPTIPGTPIKATLTSGEVLDGTLAERTDAGIILEHPLLGKVAIPESALQSLIATGEAPPPPPPAPRPGFLQGWSGSIDLGITGSSGNTERLSLRGGVSGRRNDSFIETVFDARYIYAVEEGENTENKARLDIRNDWLPQGESRWRPFALGFLEYDEFQDWDLRWGAFGGLGYEAIRTDSTLLNFRLGAGISQEIGGMNEDITPEGLIGVDFAHKIDDRSRLTANFDFFPSLDEFGPYRFVAKAAYEILLDTKSGISLKLGFEDRYDSTPEGRKRNDLDYFVLLVIPW